MGGNYVKESQKDVSTVRQLREALSGLPDDMPVVVEFDAPAALRLWDDESGETVLEIGELEAWYDKD